MAAVADTPALDISTRIVDGAALFDARSERRRDARARSEGDAMKVTVDGRLCTGHQMCAIAAPEVFGSDDYGNAVVLIPDDLPSELQPKARRAEGNCPERAIIIWE